MAAIDANPNRDAAFVGINFEIADVMFLARDYAKATERLESFEERARSQNLIPPKGLPYYSAGRFELLGRIARAQGQGDKARGYFESARKVLQDWLSTLPPDPAQWGGVVADTGSRTMGRLAEVNAVLGHNEDAIREARKAVELFPHADCVATSLAIVYMWTGDRDAALQQLAKVAKVPVDQAHDIKLNPVTAGDLKLNPIWDELRSDPRFDKIIAEAAKPVKL
jgi:tetratricopeptide (TPR) repeat protein